MENDQFEHSLSLLLESEGGFVNHPLDPGGATNKGVTLKTFRTLYPGATVDDLKQITDAQVHQVYRTLYWERIQASRLPTGIDYCLFDYAVHSGPHKAVRTAQKIAGASVDGLMGPNTRAALQEYVKTYSAKALIKKICAARLSFVQRLKHAASFRKGWTARINKVQADAIAMADHAARTDSEKRLEQLDTLEDELSWLFSSLRKLIAMGQ